MKKLLVLILVLVVASSFCVATTVLGSENSADFSVEFDVGAYTVEGTPYRRITYSVINHGVPTPIKTSLYLDGMLIVPETADYVVINDRISQSVDVYLPYLVADMQHNLTLKINSSNGYSKEETFVFSALSVKGVDLRFMHCPQTIDIGASIPLAIEVTMPKENVVYDLETVIEVNGVKCPDVGRIQPVTSGQLIYFVIPADYTMQDLEEINLKITANPNAMVDEPTGVLEISVPMTGPAAQRKQVMSMVNPVKVSAYITRDTSAYDYASLTGYRTTIPKGTYVTYLNPDNHNSMRAAKIRTASGAV